MVSRQPLSTMDSKRPAAVQSRVESRGCDESQNIGHLGALKLSEGREQIEVHHRADYADRSKSCHLPTKRWSGG